MTKNTKKNMKKMLVFGIFFLLIGVVIIPLNNGELIKNNRYSEENKTSNIQKNTNNLDLKYIYNLTENLSNIIFTAYEPGEIAKGRAFGSKGEQKAAKMIHENMTKLGLNPKYERIDNTDENPLLNTKIDIKERGLTVYNNSSGNVSKISDCYISANWNFTSFNYILEEYKVDKPILGAIFEKLLKSFIIKVNGQIDQKFNFYDWNQLDHNFSYQGLKVKRKPYNYSLALDLTRNRENKEPFVYIAKDPHFTAWDIKDTILDGFLYDLIEKYLPEYQEYFIFRLFHPNCKGLILVDSNYDTYNMGTFFYCPIPVIHVNRTVGEDMLENPDNYEIDFYLNQEYNDSVVCKNVIGEIEGNNTNETIVVCSLYDSWWCQGTADAAIGMATVLGIAKYFKDNNIVPERNIKFIAFGGEEYGWRGAVHYENTHRDEFISYVLDLNQIGFTPVIPENIKFQIWSNNEILNQSMVEFIKETNYTNRTGVEYQTRVREGGGPSNVNPFAHANQDKKRKCQTIMIVKTGTYLETPNWLHHHRDGIKHTHGDVIDNFNWNDTRVTGELVLNITKYLAIEKEDEEPDNTSKQNSFIPKSLKEFLIIKD